MTIYLWGSLSVSLAVSSEISQYPRYFPLTRIDQQRPNLSLSLPLHASHLRARKIQILYYCELLKPTYIQQAKPSLRSGQLYLLTTNGDISLHYDRIGSDDIRTQVEGDWQGRSNRPKRRPVQRRHQGKANITIEREECTANERRREN